MGALLMTGLLSVAPPAHGADCVVLLHGLGRTSHSMRSLATKLSDGGYGVVNVAYPSRKGPVQQLVQVVEDGIKACKDRGAENIHFVTHSLGGIIVRAYFQDRTVPEVRRIVMLAPPNHGSEIADAYAKTAWYRFFTGPAGQELGTGPQGIVHKLGPISPEVGVIAGTKSIDPWFAPVMPKPHDGKVSVESARLAEMRDFITVPYTHTFLANRKAVAMQVLSFLRDGRFSHPSLP